MRVKRINAVIEFVRECRSECGTVYRTTSVTLDVTTAILSLDLLAIRKLADTNPHSLRFAKPLVDGDVVEVTILRSILDHFGVDRMREITPEDLRNARVLTGLLRHRSRPAPALSIAA